MSELSYFFPPLFTSPPQSASQPFPSAAGANAIHAFRWRTPQISIQSVRIVRSTPKDDPTARYGSKRGFNAGAIFCMVSNCSTRISDGYRSKSSWSSFGRIWEILSWYTTRTGVPQTGSCSWFPVSHKAVIEHLFPDMQIRAGNNFPWSPFCVSDWNVSFNIIQIPRLANIRSTAFGFA